MTPITKYCAKYYDENHLWKDLALEEEEFQQSQVPTLDHMYCLEPHSPAHITKKPTNIPTYIPH